MSKKTLQLATVSVISILPLVLLLVTSNSAFAGDAGGAFLTEAEQAVLEELNLARTDPKQYAEFLSELKPYFNGKQLERPGQIILVTEEGVTAVDEAISFLRSTEPVPALRPSRGLSLAAQMHAKDQRDGAMGHTGSDGSQPWDRMSRYGSWSERVAENISYGGYSARGVVIQLIVDDGVPGRGHRINLFNPDYRQVGIGCGRHARFHDMCVLDFAARYVEDTEREN